MAENPSDADSRAQESGQNSSRTTRSTDWLTEMGEKSKSKQEDKKNQASTSGMGSKSGTQRGRKREREIKPIKKELHTEPELQTPDTKTVLLTYMYDNEECKDNAPVDVPIDTFLRNSKTVFKHSSYIIIFSDKYKAIINPFVPCGALESDEKLGITIKNLKKGEIPSPSSYVSAKRGKFFKVQCNGCTRGGAPRKIISNVVCNWIDKPLAVFGYNNETIKAALENDKRFSVTSEFRLQKADKSSYYQSSARLSVLAEDIYDVVLNSDNKSKNAVTRLKRPKAAQHVGDTRSPASHETVSQPEDLTQTPVQKSVKDPPLPEHYKSKMSRIFSSLFNGLSDAERQQVRSDMIEGYCRNVMYKDPMLAITHRLLTQHLDSVGVIKFKFDDKINTGTFFLLTDSLGLTCNHVLKPPEEFELKGANVSTPIGEIKFNHEDTSSKEDIYNAKVIEQDEEKDFAFLRLTKSTSQKGLLEYASPPPQDGAVSIIGHPEEYVPPTSQDCSGNLTGQNKGNSYKKIDPMCSVISMKKRGGTIFANILSDRSFIQVLTKHNFQILSSNALLTYDTCLYWGSSGSPVFDDKGNLVAMHTGGYAADTGLKKKSVIEYGRNIVDILICGALCAEELQSWFKDACAGNDDLSRYMKPGGHPDEMKTYIEELKRILKVTDQPEEQMDTS